MIGRVLCLGAAILICASASAQNLFVSSDAAGGNIYEFAPNGVGITFASGLSGALAFDMAGNLFVTADAIYKITPAGVRTTFASGPAGTPAFDSAGNLFVTTGDTDANDFPINGSGKIFKLTPNGVRTTFASGLDNPTGLAFDSAGNLFVANIRTVVQDRTFSGAIYKFTPGGAPTTFASGLTDPQALAFDNVDNLFVAEAFGGVIYKFAPSGVRSTFASGFIFAGSLACDSAGNLFVADSPAHAIYKFTPAGGQNTFAATDGVNLLAFQPTQALTPPSPPIVATPSVSLNRGRFGRRVIVTLTDVTPGTTIYYTLDGSDPTTTSLPYQGAFVLRRSATVKAIAVDPSLNESAIVIARFTIKRH